MRSLAAAAATIALAACSAQSPADRDDREPPTNLSALPPGSSTDSLANAAAASRERPALAIEGDGLRLVDPASGRARSLPFGLGRAQVMDALAFLRAPTESGFLSECGPGPLDRAAWPGGLTLYFQHNRFAGWALRAPADAGGGARLTTASGIGLGSTRASLERVHETEVFDSSLGTEFSAGKLFGLLDGAGPQARITEMWAGVSCVMR